jgi:glycosyltransferase involved in cell wall biosynthesis
MARKRILFIESNKDGTIGGSYYSLLYLLQGLDRDKYESVVMFCQENALIPEYEKVASVVIYDFDPTIYLPVRSVGEAIRYIPKFFKHVIFKQAPLRRKLREIGADAIHLNNGYIHNHEWMLAGRLEGIKVIAHDRGGQPPASFLTKLFSRLLDAIICVSDSFLGNVHGENLKPRIACRVYNGLDTSLYEPYRSHEVRDGIRRELGVAGGEILVGMVGNIDWWKGQIVLVRAVREVLGRGTDVRTIIAGQTVMLAEEYEKEIRNYISEHGLGDRISLLGFRNDIPALLNAMDIFVHASIEPEPFGRVILEAKLMAKPIIATDGGGATEQIRHGETGLLVPMDDASSMAAAIEEYTADMDRAARIGAAARKDAEEYYSVGRMVRGVEEVYERVFAGDGSIRRGS